MDGTEQSSLTSIVAVGLNGEIGVRNTLPWRLRSDLRFFKKTTVDNVVIMGRKTYESVGGCLKGRQNIVLSHRAALFDSHDGCNQSHSVAETLYLRTQQPKKQAFIIGGALTYAEFAPYVDRYLMTVVQSRFPQADAFFDDSIIGDLNDWHCREISVERIETAGADECEFTVVELRHKRSEQIAEARSELIQSYQDKNHLLRRKAIARQANARVRLDQILALA